MPAKIGDDPTHWRSRAERARTIADLMGDPDAKRMMLDVAENYEKLALFAEHRADQSKTSR
jgi:hypothetical protein